MEITWFNEKPKDCVVTLAAGSLTLNKPATTYFETAYSVMLGIDKSNKLIVIKPLSKSDAIRHDIADNKKYRITVRTSYSRVTNKAFMEEISDLSKLNLEIETHKYKATWDSKEQILIVDLKEEL
ncbi:MAG: hypothetical protein A2084_00065 [Tenericutes bacterium GWC2_39_45]|nr:MAG: hypothetical protein A2Y43_01810 [Tenericutes bacterium GWA2_38_26]OHE30569.1 MAG: hypothetical protein A2084_00065 [Tenericutes bacterium GWC2_39_45]OHE32738.1 MAG: hypothetical protein A2009_04620 [Tenericutes bacterium GWD2_38_27]OHE45595.1 MAG: hypothetical protein A2102_02565 [Tenericutes bacterium GWF2_38_8]HBG33663.1 hypothetical protein [Acholeplasmataceae bacterium]